MRRVLMLLAFVLLQLSTWMALTIGRIAGPPANPDSVVRNILYAHVPSSICALLCFVALLISSIGYLCTKKPIWDHIAAASAEVGAVFATILNLTGMVFSRAEWGTWWTPSPRLITSAILWFLYIVYLILRVSFPPSQHRRAQICAVFAIIAFLDVPMVFISARFIPDIHRPSFSFDSSWQTGALMLSMAAMALLAFLLIWLRTDLMKSKTRLEGPQPPFFAAGNPEKESVY
ncbi:MAG: cytochrome c biogenesis protein [Sedimentisphaerales bacterium]